MFTVNQLEYLMISIIVVFSIFLARLLGLHAYRQLLLAFIFCRKNDGFGIGFPMSFFLKAFYWPVPLYVYWESVVRILLLSLCFSKEFTLIRTRVLCLLKTNFFFLATIIITLLYICIVFCYSFAIEYLLCMENVIPLYFLLFSTLLSKNYYACSNRLTFVRLFGKRNSPFQSTQW